MLGVEFTSSSMVMMRRANNFVNSFGSVVISVVFLWFEQLASQKGRFLVES
jgi:hypothetical protein